MELIPAPGRQLKTWSMWLTIALVVFDTTAAVLHVLDAAHLVPAVVVTIGNLLLGAAIGIAKMLRQQIPLTPEQKVAMVEAAAAAPVKPGHADPEVVVTINNPPPPKGNP